MSGPSGPNYSVDNQISFVVQWFRTWSELQKDDFVEILAERLAPKVQMNGLVNGMNKLDTGTRRVSLFSCQVKLFNEWWQTWSPTERENLTKRLQESDPKFWTSVQEEINGTRKRLEDDFFLTINTMPLGGGVTVNMNGGQDEENNVTVINTQEEQPRIIEPVTINGDGDNLEEEEKKDEVVVISQQNGVNGGGEGDGEEIEVEMEGEGASG